MTNKPDLTVIAGGYYVNLEKWAAKAQKRRAFAFFLLGALVVLAVVKTLV
jgi:hypothetical protein